MNKIKPYGFWPGFLAGIIYFSYIFRWSWSLFPLTMFGVESGFYSLILILFLFLVSVAGMSFFWGLFSFFSLKITRKLPLFWTPLVVAGIFVIVEYLSAWGFGIIWFGSGSLLGAHWTLGNPAYLFVSSEFILKIASVWGIYGVDFLLVWILSIIFLLATGEYLTRRKILFLNLIFLISSLFFTFLFSLKSSGGSTLPTIKIAVIQTKNPAKIQYSLDEILDDYTKKLELIKGVAKNIEEGIIIFPESSNFSQTTSNFLDSGSIKNYFDKLSNKELTIIDNNVLADRESYKSRTLFVNSKSGVADFYDKQLLTPVGEYLPYLLKAFLYILGEEYNPAYTGLKPGAHSELLNLGQTKLKFNVCSDTLSPGISSQDQYGLLVSLQSIGVFRGSNAVESQFLSILRFRAAENGKYAVLASNYGRSYVINGQGKIERSTDSSGYQILTADVVPNTTRTWYNKLGDLPILLLSLAIFGTGFVFTKPSILDLFYKSGLRFKKLIG